ncbi:MAG: porin family protein [Gemmatimonadetes bacterium]|nr:porin family protein [Gemmatimonadota bacterium]
MVSLFGRSSWAIAVTVLMGVVAPSPSSAQTTLYISGGATFPTGAYAEFANTGWMAAGGVLFGVGSSGLGIGADLVYGQNNHEDLLLESAKTTVYSAMAIVDYAFGSPGKIRPFVFGGAGIAGHRFSADGVESDTDSDFAYQLGAGVDFPIGGTTSLYAEGRYIGSGNNVDTQVLAALLGFAFTLGG